MKFKRLDFVSTNRSLESLEETNKNFHWAKSMDLPALS